MLSICGHGRSGFTKSAVIGEMPPRSSIPASTSEARSSTKFGGAWMRTSGGKITRASAIASRCTSAGQAGERCMRVPGFGRKFWTMTSWICPWRAWLSAIASSAAIRSSRVSPIPTRMPVVNGIASSPAASRVARRRSGVLSGDPAWQSRSSRSVSSIMPWDGATVLSRASSSE